MAAIILHQLKPMENIEVASIIRVEASEIYYNIIFTTKEGKINQRRVVATNFIKEQILRYKIKITNK